MSEKIKEFNPEGVLKLHLNFLAVNKEIQPMYLTSVINFIGQNRCQLPTKRNEDKILQELKDVLGHYLSKATLIRTQRILTLTRRKRMHENALLLMSRTKEHFFREK